MGKEKPLKIPHLDSIKEMARFWDEHDVTDYEEEMEDGAEPLSNEEKKALSLAEQEHKKGKTIKWPFGK